MSDPSTHSEARARLIEEFRKSTVGPGQDDEFLVDPPSRTYIAGYLAPEGVEIGDQENDLDRDGDTSNSFEGVPSLINAIRPSAMGLTFHVRDGVKRVQVEVSGAFYKEVSIDKESTEDVKIGGDVQELGLLAMIGQPAETQAEVSHEDEVRTDGRQNSGQLDRWKRKPIATDLELMIDVAGEEKSEPVRLFEEVENTNLFLDVRRHNYGAGKPSLMTLTLINKTRYDKAKWREREACTFFQPSLKILACEGDEEDCFTEPPAIGSYREDPDLYQHLLLFRHSRDFATGHGCAVNWKRKTRRSQFASELRTEFVPSASVMGLKTEFEFGDSSDPLVNETASVIRDSLSDFDVEDANEIFLIENLAGKKSDDWIISALNGFCDAYKHWLNQRRQQIDTAVSEINDENIREEVRSKAAYYNIDTLGGEVVDRMRAGVKTLDANRAAPVFQSFLLANEAMFRQLQMSIAQNADRNGRAFKSKADMPQPRWRPFQLAFLLLTLNSIAEPKLKICEKTERELMDLIWFPTGGGKTEAYLGLAAFTLVYRRLIKSDPDMGAGVSVITRYTLRLLTTQQFERASRLICALECIRKSGKDLRGQQVFLGKSKFSIGLWIGGTSTPNRFEDRGRGEDINEGAISILRGLRNGEERSSGADIRQIRACPWCGCEIGTEDMDVLDSAGNPVTDNYQFVQAENYRLRFKCPNTNELPDPFEGGCLFAEEEGLPVSIVDSEIYAEQPSILIGTVDKFIRLAWSKDTRSLFGRGESSMGEGGPDLIIQDELHLISGPLGTMVGLFETAIDVISKSQVEGALPPKIVGSTATIRRAEEQVEGLFARKVRQFPPPELTMGESFFSREIEDDDKSRKYLGIMAPGSSSKSLYLRCCGVLAQLAYELPERLRDPYWTVVSYFNSIRELSGANVLAQDDVPAYMETFAEIRKSLGQSEGVRDVSIPQELTSRLSSGDIPRVLKKLEHPYKGDGSGAIDILLATNMISVGVDVDRLGLMVIQGQPKTTSEYIQASSRVGRSYPGLVLTLVNWSRSRDRSHYERFVSYHEAFYREVEPTSVTPWTGPARDRGLSAVMITILRQLELDLADTPEALGEMTEDSIVKLLQPVLNRVKASDPSEYQAACKELTERVRKWQRWSRDPQGVKYGDGMWRQRGRNMLMRSVASPGGELDGLEAVPNSMRTVEPETKYRLWTII